MSELMSAAEHRAEAERLAEYAASPESENAYDQHKSLLLAGVHASLAIAASLAYLAQEPAVKKMSVTGIVEVNQAASERFHATVRDAGHGRGVG